MAAIKASRVFSHYDDCKPSGCPAHEMTIDRNTTSEGVIVHVDGQTIFGSDKNTAVALAGLIEDVYDEQPAQKIIPPLEAMLEAIDKVKSTQHGDIENVILLPPMGNKGLVEIGSLFGLEVYAGVGLPDGVDLVVTPKANIAGQL